MKINALRMTCTAMGLLLPLLIMGGPTDRSGIIAKVTLPDGTTHMANLEGVGCPTAICSRVAIKAQAKGDAAVTTRFDALASIQDANAEDALFVLKNGIAQRRSLVWDFRVLYLANPSGGSDKLDLATIKSIEFLPAGKSAQ